MILNWGKEESFHPDETALYIARHLSDIEAVSAIIGYHPQHVQGHAYFGNTLVIFSPGNFIISSDTDSLCWEKVHLVLSYFHWVCIVGRMRMDRIGGIKVITSLVLLFIQLYVSLF